MFILIFSVFYNDLKKIVACKQTNIQNSKQQQTKKKQQKTILLNKNKSVIVLSN